MLCSNRKRRRGNWWFNRADYAEAVRCYKAAVDFLDDTDEVAYEQQISPQVIFVCKKKIIKFLC